MLDVFLKSKKLNWKRKLKVEFPHLETINEPSTRQIGFQQCVSSKTTVWE
jgi:hypothetical protein